MKIEISMRGLWGIGGTANTFGYDISVTYKDPPWVLAAPPIPSGMKYVL
jgi:hypothetical protein